LTKLTSILGAIFLLTSLGLSWIKSSNEAGDVLGAAQAQRQESSAGTDWWRTSETSAESAGETPDSGAGSETPR
jgi:preprotein translocase subunit SecG